MSMTIKKQGTFPPVRGAIGQYSFVRAGFNSDTSMSGKTLGFNPGLFTASTDPQSSAYVITYPASSGTYPMTFTASNSWKNGRAELDVFDPFNFRITFYFFYTTPIGYVNGLIPPGLPFQANGFYNGGASSIALQVNSGGSFATSLVSATAVGFNSDSTASLVVDYTNGIKVTATTSVNAESVAFMGLYTENDFARKAYAGIASNPIRTDGLDADAFITGTPFVRMDGASKASFTITPDWLADGVNYYAYVVYKSGGIWYSARSGVITKGGARTAIYGDVSYLLRDNVGNYTTGCLSDVPPCKDFSVSVRMDGASYDAALAAAGLGGTQLSRLLSVRATLQSSFTGAQGGQNLQVVVGEGASGVTALVESFVPPPGVKYIVFGFQYFFKGGNDTILVPVQISTVSVVELAAPEELCFEEEGNIIIPLPVPVGTSYVSQRDGNGSSVSAVGVSFSGDNFVVDPTTVPVGVARCYNICSEAVNSVEQDCVCDCECIGLTFNVTLTDANGGYTYQVDVGFPVSGSNVSAFEIQATGAGAQNLSGVTSVSGSGTGDNSGGRTTVYLSGQIALDNGCRYDIPVQTVQLASGGELTERNGSVQICIANCDCDEVPETDPECDNTVSFESDCSDGTLTFTASADLNSPTSSDVTECSVDGGNYGACAASYTEGETVTIRRRVTFSDGCPDIEASLTANCEIINNCENSAELTVEKTDTLLTLTLTGTYESAPATEEIYYSLNGGLAYQLYSDPVALTGTENIRAYSVTTFTDGCPDIVTPTQSAGGLTVDNTEPLVTYCNGTGDVTGFAALIGSGNDIQTIYFDTDMVQTPTVPSGSPCETFVPCATCP